MRHPKLLLPISFSLALFFCCCNNNKTQPPEPPFTPPPSTPIINYSVISMYPHDTLLYTEGFVMHDGQLFESSGAPDEEPQTRSVAGIIDLNTGKFDKKVELDRKKYFGEGIAFLNNKLYQLTYTNQEGFVYDAKTFKQVNKFTFSNKEGWALTTDSTNLIMSDGSDTLTILDAATLKPLNIIKVAENGEPLKAVNELEYIKGYIYANVYTTNTIVKIDPESGKVIGKMDLSILDKEAKSKNPHADVLNGIAYDPVKDKIYVTGKMWPNIYEINFSH